jgi:TolB-like protein/DNA-binding winged helix-turn-helix (wHTH) protein/tetratricopeptide (TPR) repeat protein
VWYPLAPDHPPVPDASQSASIRRFGPFEINLQSEELRKSGMRVRLSGQPFQVLAFLVERAGEIVTREELRSRLWPADTFVDFDHGLNNAVARIREVLDDSSDRPRYVETVPRRGYRFVAPVADVLPAAAAESPVNSGQDPARPGTSDNSAGSAEQKFPSKRMRVLLAGLAALMLFSFAVLLYRGRGATGTRPPKIKSLAVLPLKNLSGDPTQEYLADGMTEALIGRLSMIRGLRVISRTSVMSLKDSRLSAPDIARTLQVDALVEGSVIREGSRIRVYAQLIRGATDDHFWSETYDRELPDVLALESDVAQSVARKVEVTVTGEEHSRLVAARHVSPDVYESYLKGQFAKGNSRAEIEQSIAYFEDAITKDATFAPAYVGLADAYERLGGSFLGAPTYETRPKVIRAAQKALDLDPGLAEAHALLGRILKKQFKWADAEAEYKQALALNPNNATAHLEYAEWLVSHGRVDEALAWSERARELDPLGKAGETIGWILFQARRYDDSIRELRSFLAVHADDAIAHLGLAFPMIANGQAEDAIPDLEKTASMMHRSPGALELLATAHARAGHRAAALRLLEELRRRRETGYVQATSFINPNLGLGNYDEAFVWFERAYREREGILQWLKVHPFFDPVRGDPRFANLLHRVGLDQPG